MNNFLVDSFALSEDFVNVFLIGKVRSGLSGDCILSGASLPGSRAEVVILSGPSIRGRITEQFCKMLIA